MVYLNQKQIKKFAKKYIPEKIDKIQEVSLLKYKGKEYLVDHQYLVVVKPFKVIIKHL